MLRSVRRKRLCFLVHTPSAPRIVCLTQRFVKKNPSLDLFYQSSNLLFVLVIIFNSILPFPSASPSSGFADGLFTIVRVHTQHDELYFVIIIEDKIFSCSLEF